MSAHSPHGPPSLSGFPAYAGNDGIGIEPQARYPVSRPTQNPHHIIPPSTLRHSPRRRAIQPPRVHPGPVRKTGVSASRKQPADCSKTRNPRLAIPHYVDFALQTSGPLQGGRAFSLVPRFLALQPFRSAFRKCLSSGKTVKGTSVDYLARRKPISSVVSSEPPSPRTAERQM